MPEEAKSDAAAPSAAAAETTQLLPAPKSKQDVLNDLLAEQLLIFVAASLNKPKSYDWPHAWGPRW